VFHDQPSATLLDRADHDLVVMAEQLDGMLIAPPLGNLGEALDVGEENHQHRGLPLHAVLLDARKVMPIQFQGVTGFHATLLKRKNARRHPFLN